MKLTDKGLIRAGKVAVKRIAWLKGDIENSADFLIVENGEIDKLIYSEMFEGMCVGRLDDDNPDLQADDWVIVRIYPYPDKYCVRDLETNENILLDSAEDLVSFIRNDLDKGYLFDLYNKTFEEAIDIINDEEEVKVSKII